MEAREVRGPFNAVEITLSQPRFLCFRILDYRSKALEDMLDEDIVGRTRQGKYYLTGRRSSVNQDFLLRSK